MPATFHLEGFHFHVLPMRTRFPFQYGIASMTALPHLFVSVDLVVKEKLVRGLASEGLPPKWFTKDPATLFEQDLAEMLAVIQNASRIARHAAAKDITFFAWWRALYEEQAQWAKQRGVPSLLANLGTSLIERAVIDGLCKGLGQPLHTLLQTDALAIDLGSVRSDLLGMSVHDVIPAQPLTRIQARHTVGLADPLRAADIPEAQRLHDGLPHALEDCIRAYGLRYFKLKANGKPEQDIPRLREIAAVLTECCGDDFHCTLDGNEQFHDLAGFRDFYRTLTADAALRPLFDHLILIEQPMHRAHALEHSLAEWKDGPAIIIDESDGSLDDLPRAIELGYRGTSHKNCKGIVKGLANAALLKKHGLTHLSGEDLANVGPVALLQDLSVMALLGVSHVERNGHHYFRGLSAHSEQVQADMLATHAGLYERRAEGFASLRIVGGELDVGTVNAAPFGCGIQLDVEQFEPLNAWIKRGGMGEL